MNGTRSQEALADQLGSIWGESRHGTMGDEERRKWEDTCKTHTTRSARMARMAVWTKFYQGLRDEGVKIGDLEFGDQRIMQALKPARDETKELIERTVIMNGKSFAQGSTPYTGIDEKPMR